MLAAGEGSAVPLPEGGDPAQGLASEEPDGEADSPLGAELRGLTVAAMRRAAARRAGAGALVLSFLCALAAVGLVTIGGSSQKAPGSTAAPQLLLSNHTPTQAVELSVNTAATPTPPPALPAGWSTLFAIQTTQANIAQQLSQLTLGTQSSTTANNLNAVHAIDNSHVWAAGQNCALLFSGNGTTWTKDTHVPASCTSGAVNLTGISVNGAGPGWAVGSVGTVLVCSTNCNTATAVWTSLGGSPIPPTTVSFAAVWGNGNTVYAVGTSGGNGVIWACMANCNSTTAGSGTGKALWTNVTPTGLTGVSLTGVTDPGVAVAVGSSGTALVCNTAPCTGANWKHLVAGVGGTIPPTTVTFAATWASDSNHIYAVGNGGGNGVIWACSANCGSATAGTGAGNATWRNITPPGLGTTVLAGVSGNGADLAWAVGASGAIWYCPKACATTPTSWVSMGRSSLTTSNLNAVSSSDPKHLWAVGNGGTIVAFLMPGGSAGNNATQLIQALQDLGPALNPALWTGTDGNHLNASTGINVFKGVQAAVAELMTITTPWPSWVMTYTNYLVGAGRLIATTAISDNSCSPAHPASLSAAQSSLSQGDAAYDSGQFSTAVQDYGTAWQDALAAQGTSCSTGGITLNPSGSLFTVTNMVPGDSDMASVIVTVTGSPTTSAVVLTETNTGSTACSGCHAPVGTATDLDNQLVLTITDITGSPVVVYGPGPLVPGSGFTPLSLCGFGSGCSWGAGESHSYKFTVSMPSSLGNTYQGTGAMVTFVWTRN